MKVEVAVLGSPVPNSPYGLCKRTSVKQHLKKEVRALAREQGQRGRAKPLGGQLSHLTVFPAAASR